MKDHRSISQVSALGQQLFVRKTKGFLLAYEDALSKPYGYIVIDSSPRGVDRFRIRTNIFPGEEPIVYVLK